MLSMTRRTPTADVTRSARGPVVLTLATGVMLALAAASPAEAQVNPDTVELDPTPVRLPTAGIAVHIPVGSTANTTWVGPQASLDILAQDQTWLIKVVTIRPSDPTLTRQQLAEQILRQLKESVSVRQIRPGEHGPEVQPGQSLGQVLAFEPELTISGRAASRLYFQAPAPGSDTAALVHGHTVLAHGPGRFVTFELITTATEFSRTRRIYETVVAGARLEDPDQAAAARAAAIETGVALRARLDAEDLTVAIGLQPEQWFRLYKPGPTGLATDDTELAYRRVRTWVGQRGELHPGRPRARWSAADLQEGYLVSIAARLLQDDRIYDTISIFFMTPDGEEEAWSVRMAIRQRAAGARAPEQWTVTGARDGRTLTVSTASGSQPAEVTRARVPERGYLTQVEQYLLPTLLARTGIAGEFGFYAYQSARSAIVFRRDTLAPGSGDAAWELATRFEDETPVQVTQLDQDGRILRSVLSDGRVWEPIELARLHQLWKSKGLPLD